MIILDTNIVSEFMGTPPHPGVEAWLGLQSIADIGITAILTAEILSGLEILPSGRRRSDLLRDFRAFRRQIPEANVLAFDEGAAEQYGVVVAQRQAMGRPIKVLDAQIAAIARVSGTRLATRNVRDFEGLGVQLVNPFEHQA